MNFSAGLQYQNMWIFVFLSENPFLFIKVIIHFKNA